MPGPPMLGTNGALTNGRSQPMEMIREGLLRLWVISTILFLAAVGAWFYRPFEKEFHRADLAEQIRSSATPLVPIACGEARGASGSDYLSDGTTAIAGMRCRSSAPTIPNMSAWPIRSSSRPWSARWVGLADPRRPWIPLLCSVPSPSRYRFLRCSGLGGAAAGRAVLPAPRRHPIGPGKSTIYG